MKAPGTVAPIGVGLALLGGIGVIVGSAMPWVGLGGVERSAFTLARVANEMEVFERRSQRMAVYALWSTPVIVPLGLVLLSVGRRRLSALVWVLGALIGVASGGIGTWASIARGPGPMVTSLGGLSALFGSCLLAVSDPTTGVARDDRWFGVRRR